MHWKIPFVLALGFMVTAAKAEAVFSKGWPKGYYVGFRGNSSMETLEQKPSSEIESFIAEHGKATKRKSLAFSETTFPYLTMYVCDENLVLNSLYSIHGMRSGGIAIMRVARENIEIPPEGGWRLRSHKPDELTFIPEDRADEFLKLIRMCSKLVDADLAADSREREEAEGKE